MISLHSEPRSGFGRICRWRTQVHRHAALGFLVIAVPACSRRQANTVPIGSCDTVSTVLTGPPPRLPAFSFSSSAAAVVGTVQDRQTAVAVQGAVVQLRGSVAHDVGTDANGGFSVSDLPSGDYTVSVVRVGYDAVRDSIRLTGGRVDTVRYAMQYRSCP